jgi:hypothetical protein
VSVATKFLIDLLITLPGVILLGQRACTLAGEMGSKVSLILFFFNVTNLRELALRESLVL